LFIGVVITSIVQSSSFTTVLVVSLVVPHAIGGETYQILTVRQAIPIVMGANIGTTITNTLVSLAHVSRRDEFRRAFSGAVVHDIFNILTVAVLFPMEQAWRLLERLVTGVFPAATTAAVPASVPATAAGPAAGPTAVKIPNVLDYVCNPLIDAAKAFLHDFCGLGNTPAGIVLAVVGAVLLFVSLIYMVVQLKKLVLVRLERFFDRVLFRNGPVSLLVGLILTCAVQSSSVTTSLVVPLLGAGVLTLEQVFPYTIGANTGTTITAQLAALAVGSTESMQIALVHTTFNCIGAAIWLPLRLVPLGIARYLGREVQKRRWFAFVYLGIVFLLIPGIAIALGYILGMGQGGS
jgi:sodium-dependent phosphate cotransporter